ncbi:tRNA(His) guanylyltransferase 2-like isoform X3 [Musa acuminata AAA Group]|uniref:tRNA(His) guanylyltransferase 2-like isoform X3 n=1 Tax=Musa acuminata AAA Group TaxID=214697 RepID=UPI0031E1534D
MSTSRNLKLMTDCLPPVGLLSELTDAIFTSEATFSEFSAEHAFEKPNDENALNLMNSCAVSMLEQFPDIVFAYGVSDEYSFIWKETTQFYQRRSSKLLSLSVSYFTSVYVMKWKEFFPHKELKGPPYFDGRVVCYPRAKIVQDYLAWRQVDCHINNQYNTCFWMLVKSGKTQREAQELLKFHRAHKQKIRMSCFFNSSMLIMISYLKCFEKDLVFTEKRWKKWLSWMILEIPSQELEARWLWNTWI